MITDRYAVTCTNCILPKIWNEHGCDFRHGKKCEPLVRGFAFYDSVKEK
jgi:hypothetical protein